MVIFHSMTSVTVMIVVVVALLLWAATKRSPHVTAGIFVQQSFTSVKYVIHFIAMIGILFVNKIELSVEKMMDQSHLDFTHLFYSLESGFIPFLQSTFENITLTAILSFFYVVVFPTLMIVSIGVYTHDKQPQLYYSVCYALIVNYVVAIPFYLFFPVFEAWSYNPDVRFLIPDVFPTFELDYRPLSGIDNCFPSLHTSISVTMFLLARKSKSVFWRRFTMISMIAIIFSISYLGIHWLADTAGGVLLGIIAAKTALRISEIQFSGFKWRSSVKESEQG